MTAARGELPLDDAGEVRGEERIDLDRLRPFVEAALGARGPLTLRQFGKGHSNLTYLVEVGGREAVLRRAPFGASAKGGHDMRREFAVLAALEGAYPKAPRPIALCDDASLIGARFFLMQRVRGVVLRGSAAPPGVELAPPLLRALSTALVDDLAALHAVDVTRPAVAALGHPEGYVARQVSGWTERWQRARTDDVPAIEAVARWLAGHLPPSAGAALVHNDFKHDNLVLDPADPSRIVAVLDWEMATVGDPLMDLGTTLGYWVDPDDPPDVRALPFGPTALPGSRSRLAVVERYAERSGRDVGDVLFHYAFALFKIAVIAQQIYKRFVEGHTSDPRFASLLLGVRILGGQAERALDRGRIHALG